MRATRMPAPEALNRPRDLVPARSPITFRLTEADEEKLHKLARRARLGRSTLARRIVEHYIQQHAPRPGRKRS
jgi:hypothetical protein